MDSDGRVYHLFSLLEQRALDGFQISQESIRPCRTVMVLFLAGTRMPRHQPSLYSSRDFLSHWHTNSYYPQMFFVVA